MVLVNKITVGSQSVNVVDADPSSSGVVAVIGSIAMLNTTGALYTKTGAGDTAWTLNSSTNIESGTVSGQMLYWDNTALTWEHSETDEIQWDDSGKRFLLSTSNGAGFGWVFDTTTNVLFESAGKSITPTSITNASSPYTALVSDQIIYADASAGNVTINLPTALSAAGSVFTIKKIDSSVNTITIDANGAQTIDGALTQVIALQWASLQIHSNAATWFIIAKV
jgi:hypothetical protein